MKYQNLRLLYVLVFLIFVSCSKKEIACTFELRTISVTVKDELQKPVVLESFKVINKKNGKDITLKVDEINENGKYALVSDSHNFDGKTEVQFIGYISGKEVIKKNYLVGTDGCHVIVISGELDIVL